MITGKEDLQQALIEAFLMEKGTMEFYQHADEISAAPEVKKRFRHLSGWEEKHMDFILFLYQSINDNRDIKTFEEFKRGVEAPLSEADIPVKDLDLKVEKQSFRDDAEALALALEIEQKSYDMYQRFAENAADADARIIFKEMMDQETRHAGYLEDLRTELMS